jgi:hypothetical protein
VFVSVDFKVEVDRAGVLSSILTSFVRMEPVLAALYEKSVKLLELRSYLDKLLWLFVC